MLQLERTHLHAPRLDPWISSLGFLEEPPLVSSRAPEVVSRVHVTRFSAGGALAVAPDLYFNYIKRCTKLWLEEVVENLRTVWFAVVSQ